MDAEELLRRYADGERAFEGVDLRRVDLCNANLSGINLRNSYIEEIGLIHINLSGANLEGIDLRDIVLENANLSAVNMIEANLSEVNLMCANITDAIFNGACLSNVRLLYANLSRSIFRNTNMNEVDFDGANLVDADFRDAKDAYLDDIYIFDPYLRYAAVKPVHPNLIERGGAIFCRTIMPDGSICNDGCDRVG
ncbi:pentapeptide repeat-containing protein [Microcoleus sp.]|uniref:pentapeptide repeat-containing protein n=1 Tax=Microcoleus sp. TaxID=44472 RepID=UPI0035940287